MGIWNEAQEWHVEDVKKWSSDIAHPRKHKFDVVMLDNAGENKSQDIIDFFASVRVKYLFQHCTRAMAEWTRWSSNQFEHNGSKDNHGEIWTGWSILAQGRFKLAACDACNAIHMELIGTTWWRCMARCKMFLILCIWMNGMCLSRFWQTREGQAYAVEPINLRFELNTSAQCFFIPEKNNLFTSNQARFDVCLFPFK